jgi:hypothetical protein
MPATQSLREKSNFLQSSLPQDKEATFLPASENMLAHSPERSNVQLN